MQNLISEGEEMIKEAEDEDTRDAVIIASAQKTEHYEMAGYGTVRSYALILGENDHADLLQQTLEEEKEADELLTNLAERSINIDATIGDEASDEAGSSSDREVRRQVASDRSTGSSSSRRTRSERSDRDTEARDR
jgi:hypothetical protein